MFQLVSYWWFRRTQYITSIGLFYKEVGDFTWSVTDCEELVGAITGDGVTNLRRKPKLLFWRMCPVSFWFFLSTEGSFTDFKIFISSFLFFHASVRLTSGQTPKASNFPFPMNWYFILQYMFPLWSRSRKRYTHKWSAWASWFYILYKIILKCVQTLPSPVITKWL